MDDGKRLWQRQDWDTKASYRAFFEFYLAQEPPRSLNQAYRVYQRYKGAKTAPKRANGTWECWYDGKTASGKPIPGSVGWAARATAYDDYQNNLVLEQATKDKLTIRAERRAMLQSGHEKITAVLDKFDPSKFDASKLTDPNDLIKALGILANSARVIADQLRLEYDDQPETAIKHSGIITTAEAPKVVVYIPDNGRNDRN